MWTDHCLDTGDSDFPSTLEVPADAFIVKKGMNLFVDAYSAFMDNTNTFKTELHKHLQDAKISTLYIVGIATDVCVLETVIDARAFATPYKVTLVKDATAAVLGNQDEFDNAVTAMEAAGATIKTTAEVLAMCKNDDGKETKETSTNTTDSAVHNLPCIAMIIVGLLPLVFAQH